MPDSFDAADTRVPTTVPSVSITLDVYAGNPNTYAASYRFVVRDAFGEDLEIRQGNLIPHMTTAQRNAAGSFLDSMLTKAQAVIP